MGNPFQITEQRVLAMLRSGQPVDMSNGEGTDVAEAASWGPERTVRAEFIRELCLDKHLTKVLSPRGLCLARGKIVGVLDLEALNIPFRISLNQCYCPDPIDLRHAAVPSLDFSGCRTGRINADGITVSADMQLANGFMAEGSVSLIGATVKGNLSCVRGHFDNTKEEIPGGRRCKDCRTRLLCAYALVLERAKVEGSLFLCDGFHSVGGVHLGDARVGVNLNCTSGTFMASIHASCPGGTTGRRLACATESHNNFFCGFNGEGLHVKGNLIFFDVYVSGETRLTGAHIEGDIDSTKGRFSNQRANAMYADRLQVGGNAFFCDDFSAEGIVRMPRAQVGADLSFLNGSIVGWDTTRSLLYCEGIHVQGSIYLNNFRSSVGYVELSYSNIGGNLDCADSFFDNPNGYSIKAKGLDIKGSAFLWSRERQFEAKGLITLSGTKIGLDLMCTNGKFSSEPESEVEMAEDTLFSIEADNMTVKGKIEMGGTEFYARGAVDLDYTEAGSYVSCAQGTFFGPKVKDRNYRAIAISAGKLQAGGSVYLNSTNIHGIVMLNEASIGRNLNCNEACIYNEGERALWAVQMRVAGAVLLDNVLTKGKTLLNNSTVGGDLQCYGASFKNRFKSDEDITDEKDKLPYAMQADGINVRGSVKFDKMFEINGIVSFQNATIGMAFYWKNIKDNYFAALFLDSTKAEILDDEAKSWPAKGRLQINGFEYQFLKDLTPEGLKARREEWLRRSTHFRMQPYEHLAAILRRNGYEDEAIQVLIDKNKEQTNLPIQWPRIDWIHLNEQAAKVRPERPRPWTKIKWPHLDAQSVKVSQQTQRPWTKVGRRILGAAVAYGYRPSWAALYGAALILAGWYFFYLGFGSYVMVPTRDLSAFSQVAKAPAVPKTTARASPTTPVNLNEGRLLYSFVYSFETFIPLIELETAESWLPTAYPSGDTANGWGLGFWLCLYRWLLKGSGWILSSFFVAAISGLVRK